MGKGNESGPKSQIKSKDGLWSSCYEFFLEEPEKFFSAGWLCEDFIKKLAKAAASAKPGSELAECSELLEGMKLVKGADLVLPWPPGGEAIFEAGVPSMRKKIEANPGKHGVYANQAYSNEQFEKQVTQALDNLRQEALPKKKQRWLLLPRSYDFQADPGKAQKVDHGLAQGAIDRCQKLTRVAGLLSKAVAQAKALGATFNAWEMPTKKLPKSVVQMSEATAVPFVAAEVYAQRSCFAVYIDNGAHSGFESTRKDIKPDLGSARLFPDEAMATRYAKGRFRSIAFAIVAVQITPMSFKPVGKGDFSELQAVIAAKEALEIESAIKGARIEALEAELAARRSAEPSSEEAAPRAKKARL